VAERLLPFRQVAGAARVGKKSTSTCSSERFIVETIMDQLKNISQVEHSRHRSPANFAVNLLAGLIAYTHQPKKPSLRLPPDLAQLPAMI